MYIANRDLGCRFDASISVCLSELYRNRFVRPDQHRQVFFGLSGWVYRVLKGFGPFLGMGDR